MDENGTVLFSDLAPDRVSSERVQLKTVDDCRPLRFYFLPQKNQRSPQPIAEVNRAGPRRAR